MSIPVYAPLQSGAGGPSIPFYVPQQRQGGGGLGVAGRAGRGFLHYVRPKLDQLKNAAIDRGAQALSNVATDVIDGKDLGAALNDEATKARVDLKKNVEKQVSKASSVKAGLQNKGKKYTKQTLNSLF